MSKIFRSYITFGAFEINEVLPFVRDGKGRKEYRVGNKLFVVKMGSTRYLTFKRSLSCASCGRKGTRFYLQNKDLKWRFYDEDGRISYPDRVYKAHFNLYSETNDGGLILMTKDHIIPKSLGGSNRISNLQTMCSPCNNRKGNTYGREQEKETKGDRIYRIEDMQPMQIC